MQNLGKQESREAAVEGTIHRPRRVLDPSERIAEILFGLIMVLTFTGSLSIAEAGREDVRTMLIGALGCNIAWGVIDAVLYLMGNLAEKGRNLQIFRAVRQTRDPERAQRLIEESLPSVLARVIQPAEFHAIHRRLLDLPDPLEKAHLDSSDWRGGAGVFLLVFLSTFPVALPFIFMQHANTALRTSNLIAMVMLFALGVAYGRLVGRSAFVVGILMVILGGLLVGLTIALGG